MLVDTNVLVDVLENDPTWADWSIAQQRAQAQIHRFRGLLHRRPCCGVGAARSDTGCGALCELISDCAVDRT
jgi:hypothetical protein